MVSHHDHRYDSHWYRQITNFLASVRSEAGISEDPLRSLSESSDPLLYLPVSARSPSPSQLTTLTPSAGKCRSESIQKNKIDPKLTGLYHNSDSTLPRTYHHQQPILPLIHSSNPTMSSPDNTPTNTRRIRRTRVPSSLEGMLSPEEDTSIPKLSPTNSDYSHTERQELQEMALKLRRTKRRLLLKSAEQPSNNVDRLREMLLQLSVGSSGDDFHNAPYSMRARSSSLGSSTNSME
jgi:hypothetical protein